MNNCHNPGNMYILWLKKDFCKTHWDLPTSTDALLSPHASPQAFHSLIFLLWIGYFARSKERGDPQALTPGHSESSPVHQWVQGNVGNGSGSLENRHMGVLGAIRAGFLEKTDQSQFSISFLSSGLVFFIQVTSECYFFLSWEEYKMTFLIPSTCLCRRNC